VEEAIVDDVAYGIEKGGTGK
jgi:hypothetical protein